VLASNIEFARAHGRTLLSAALLSFAVHCHERISSGPTAYWLDFVFRSLAVSARVHAAAMQHWLFQASILCSPSDPLLYKSFACLWLSL